MRHLKIRSRLNRTTSHRIAMMRNMAVSLFRHERIITTISKSRVLVPYAEKMITRARQDDVATRRLLAPRLGGDETVLKKLFTEIAPKFASRPGGYLRVIKLGQRPSDSTLMVVVELVEKVTAPTIAEKAAEKEKRTEKKGKVPTAKVRKSADITKKKKEEERKRKPKAEPEAPKPKEKKVRPGKTRKIGESIG
jgi:large subunit ribosomal protein L17